MTEHRIAGARPSSHDTALHLVHRRKTPTLGDKLQRLAVMRPKCLIAIEAIVDYLLDTLKSA